MNQQQIERAIARLLMRIGENNENAIERYIRIMEMLRQVDVFQSEEFQQLYNGFYGLGRYTQQNRNIYYEIFQAQRGNPNINFDDVLDELYEALGTCEYSFASKMVATINPYKPVLDQYILRNTSHIPPRQRVIIEIRIAEAKLLYRCIECWYVEFLQSKEGKLCLKLFDKHVPNRYYNNAGGEQVAFTKLKKVDFILWQHRMPDYRQMDCNH